MRVEFGVLGLGRGWRSSRVFGARHPDEKDEAVVVGKRSVMVRISAFSGERCFTCMALVDWEGDDNTRTQMAKGGWKERMGGGRRERF